MPLFNVLSKIMDGCPIKLAFKEVRPIGAYKAKSSLFFFVLNVFLFAKMARPKVSNPNLPTNMVVIRTIFPKGFKLPVMPVLRPTVPMAEVVSKRICSKGIFSERDNRKVAKNITDAYSMKTEVAT